MSSFLGRALRPCLTLGASLAECGLKPSPYSSGANLVTQVDFGSPVKKIEDTPKVILKIDGRNLVWRWVADRCCDRQSRLI